MSQYVVGYAIIKQHMLLDDDRTSSSSLSSSFFDLTDWSLISFFQHVIILAGCSLVIYFIISGAMTLLKFIICPRRPDRSASSILPTTRCESPSEKSDSVRCYLNDKMARNP
jgi:hypothetical protein